MTNKELWNLFTDGSPSSTNYLDWCWLYTISSALQRRVWIGPEGQQCFPNMQTILVGPPASGKGTAIRPTIELLSFWDKSDFIPRLDNLSENDKTSAKLLAESELARAIQEEEQGRNKKGDIFKPKLFPDAGDAITYESLVEVVAQSYARISHVSFDDKLNKEVWKAYGHSSMYFALPELASLFRKRAEDTINYLLGIYDCPDEYRYSTKTKGKDRVRRPCLNLLAGTTPTFLQETFDEKLIGEGFASRTFFIWAARGRKIQGFFPPQTQEQKEAKKLLCEHLRNLSQLYGQVTFDIEVYDYINEILKRELSDRLNRPNKDPILDSYYGRKNQHIIKLAMAWHFGESVDRHIKFETFKVVYDFLSKEERTMHIALSSISSNVHYKISKKILEMLAESPKRWIDIYTECAKFGPKIDIEEALSFLMDTEQIKVETKIDEQMAKEIRYWRIV